MKKYSADDFYSMSNEEKLAVGKILLEGKIVRKTVIDGIQCFECTHSSLTENILIEEELNHLLKLSIYNSVADEIKRGDIKTAFNLFEIILRRFADKEKISTVLSKANKKFLKLAYINYRKQIQEIGIDIFKYMAPEALYQDILEEALTLLKDGDGTEDLNIATEKLTIVVGALTEVSGVLDNEIAESGGIENWIEKKGLTKKKSNTTFAKERLLMKIYNEENSLDDKKRYARLLLRVGYCSEDLLKQVKNGDITPENLGRMYDISELRKIVVETVGKLKLHDAIISFIQIGDEKVLDEINWNRVTAQELKSIAEDDLIPATAIAFFIIKKNEIQKKIMTEAEIDMIFENKRRNRNDIIRTYFELARREMYTEDKLIQLYGEEIEDENMEDPYQMNSRNRVSINELLSLFNPNKVISKLEGYYDRKDERAKVEKKHLMYFYFALLEACEISGKADRSYIEDELQIKLQQKIDEGEDKAALIAIELFENGVLDIERIKEILNNQDIIFDLYGKGLDDNKLLSLYKSQIASKDLIELLYEEVTPEELANKLENHEIARGNIALLYFLGIIRAEQVGECSLTDINWKRVMQELNETDVASKISVLYKNGNIGFEEVKELKEAKIIGAKEAEAILNQIDLDGIIINGLTSEEGIGTKGKRKRMGSSGKREGISLEDRDELLQNLGFNAIANEDGETLVVAEGSFKGYRVYRDTQRNFGVIVFENKSDGSSFIMHEAKAGEFIRTQNNEATLVGSRSQWREKARTDGSVTAKSHTVQWGRNIIGAIVENSSIFKFDDEEERRKYVKTETQKLCEEHKDTIEYIRLLKQEQLEQM